MINIKYGCHKNHYILFNINVFVNKEDLQSRKDGSLATVLPTENMGPKTPKVYISYSWSSEDHQKWIIKLAEDLMTNGVEVKLDVWDLKEGHDIYDFMESMVKDPEIDRVLVICDKGYFEKAETRKGGVGT
jgi:hypothetical protein